ncbi:MAG: DUF4389 domain-containing protein [Alphaproteobacteria bacterium]|nr:MAG: DUF4389 domain-containing protein [Alphaproteobacteria bacterium]
MSMSDASDGDFENTQSSDQTSQKDQGSDDGAARRGALERGLFMLLFGVLGYLTIWAVMLLAIIQWIFVLINKEPNADIKRFSTNLAEYLAQIARFLGFATDEKPCPFSPFPRVASDD